MGLFGLGRPDVSRLAAARNVSGLVAASAYRRDPAVRKAAVEALGRIAAPEALDALVAALADADTGIRLAAIEALGNLRHIRAVQALAGLLEAEDPAARRAAVRALATSGTEDALPRLVLALGDNDPTVRAVATESVRKAGDSALELLLASASSARPSERLAAIDLLGSSGHTRALDGLLALFSDPSAEVRVRAVLATIPFAKRRAVDALERVLSDPDERVRLVGIEAAGRRAAAHGPGTPGHPAGSAATRVLVDRLRDQSPEVQEKALQALVSIGDTRVVGPLMSAIAGGSDTPRALDAVAALDPVALVPLIEAEPDVAWLLGSIAPEQHWPRLLKAIAAEGGEHSMRAVLGILQRLCLAHAHIAAYNELTVATVNWVNDEVTAAALDALLAIALRTNTAPPLALYLQFSALCADCGTRVTRALDQVGKRRMASAVEPLLALSVASRRKDQHEPHVLPGGIDWSSFEGTPDLRRRALQVVADLVGPEAAAEAWWDQHKGAFWVERRGAIHAADILWDSLGGLGHSAGPLLRRLAQHADAPLRMHAIQLLAELRIPGSQPIFERAFTDPGSDVSGAAALALSGLGDRAVPFLAQHVCSQTWALRKRAVGALVRIKTPRARGVLDDVRKTEQDLEILRAIDGD